METSGREAAATCEMLDGLGTTYRAVVKAYSEMAPVPYPKPQLIDCKK
jgi:hypothetical protein